jgi:CBS-domain-containing membrane protein
MDKNHADITPELSDQDLREALKELKTYVDITEEDLRKIYAIALKHARRRLGETVLVRDIMTKDVVKVKRDTNLQEAARRLSGLRISGMPVVDDANRVIGVISEADILSLAGVKRGHTFKDILRHVLGEPLPGRKKGNTVGDVMSSPAITTGPDTDIREVAAILDDRRIKRLPVVDTEGKLAGIVSREDIVRMMGKVRKREA